jgi:hypothetical protein
MVKNLQNVEYHSAEQEEMKVHKTAHKPQQLHS